MLIKEYSIWFFLFLIEFTITHIVIQSPEELANKFNSKDNLNKSNQNQ